MDNSASNVKYKIIGGFFIFLAVVIVIAIGYKNSQRSQRPIIYSTKFMLDALWASYKRSYIDPSGRTLDPQRGSITTSEGQSYTMLRAVWEDDKSTFDSSWQWTRQNLKRPDDNLFSWLFGKKSDGSYGILTDQSGNNSASDADSDIALALVEASARWQDPSYLQAAKALIQDIWKNEVVTIQGRPYLTADNLEQKSTGPVLIDPSYLSPYSYRIFAQIDPSDNWQAVIDSSYKIIQESAAAPLDKNSSAGLPPDWITIDKNNGQISKANSASATTNYGYDALRIPFRLALDYQWNQDPRDKTTLDAFTFLSLQVQSKNLLYSTYGHDGMPVYTNETPSMYGGSLGYFIVSNPTLAAEVYNNKLLSLYSPDDQDWKQQLGYYDSNWAWFGLALYNKSLINYYSPPSQ